MRIVLLVVAVVMTGCYHGFEFHIEDMTPDQMLQRADLVFIGVVEGHHFDSYPLFRVRVPRGMDPELWQPLRRRVRVETVLVGAYADPKIDVFEIFGTGGATGDWNATMDGGRYLFMVHNESGRWRIVRDWWRSIYEVRNGSHARLPLSESRPFWERYALMNYWMESEAKVSFRLFGNRPDPANTLGRWRTTKLLRGLLRHPQSNVRIMACVELDESRDNCYGMFSKADWDRVYGTGRIRREPVEWDATREAYTRGEFARMLYAQSMPRNHRDYTPWAMDELRVLTTIGHPPLRREFCREFVEKFPADTDNGCPTDKPIPATIVTADGDVPLVGDWPQK